MLARSFSARSIPVSLFQVPPMVFCPSASATVVLLTMDPAFAAGVSRLLADQSNRVTSHDWTSSAAIVAHLREQPDIVVLDARTSASVASAVRTMRRQWPSMGLLVANACDDREVRALLDAGADDVCMSDFPMLTARVHAIARRARAMNACLRVAIGDVVFERDVRRVWCAGREVLMTPCEYSVVDCLFWHAPAPVTLRTLSTFVGARGKRVIRPNTTQVYVGYVRRKLSPSRSVVITTMRGVGYLFAPRAVGARTF